MPSVRAHQLRVTGQHFRSNPSNPLGRNPRWKVQIRPRIWKSGRSRSKSNRLKKSVSFKESMNSHESQDEANLMIMTPDIAANHPPKVTLLKKHSLFNQVQCVSTHPYSSKCMCAPVLKPLMLHRKLSSVHYFNFCFRLRLICQKRDCTRRMQLEGYVDTIHTKNPVANSYVQ